ncbi:MAG: helix-turn-helix domain-containing protein, partial [Planctomycetales bacterium]
MKIRLSKKERNRVRVLGQVKLGKVSLKKAGELPGVSYRQVRRIYQRYTREGVEGLKHGLRDRMSNHQIGSSHRERILKLYEAKYGDFGPTLAVEYLRKEDGEEVGVETLRRWLV